MPGTVYSVPGIRCRSTGYAVTASRSISGA